MATPAHIRSAEELLTSPSDILWGFRFQARLKRKLADPKVRQAFRFIEALKEVPTLDALFENVDLQPHLLTSAGFSEKSIGHLQRDAKGLYVETRNFLSSVYARSGANWKQEIVFRFMLTQGDTLGGQSRNQVGERAKRRLARTIKRAALAKHSVGALVDIRGRRICSIRWPNRTLLFDRKHPLIAKNVDVILLDSTNQRPLKEMLRSAQAYICCGELKGGIDPAGADEHWKTALSALDRLRRDDVPNMKLFFVGAAIDNGLATDIFERMSCGSLDFAANLHSKAQLNALIAWLLQL